MKMFSSLIFILIFQFKPLVSLGEAEERCDSNQCENGTTCTYTNTSDCTCMQGFHGNDCIDVNECDAGQRDPCFHRGLCTNTPGSYRCTCLTSWSGNHCQHNLTNTPECLPGYTGSKCEIALCKNGYALNSTNTGKNFTCVCYNGWNHTHIDEPCDLDINECFLYPHICKNGGNCRNTNGSYNCHCIEPWEGENCTYYNSCRSNPCENQGECIKTGKNDDKTYKCMCQPGYEGENCTVDVDECSVYTRSKCLNRNENESNDCHKICKNNCDDMRAGFLRADDPCGNRGVCVNEIGSYRCECLKSWSGIHCEKNLTSQPECSFGYTGDMCDIALCQHGYAINSTDVSRNLSCICDKGWKSNESSGACEVDINECEMYPSICQNGGNCINNNGSYMCNCIGQWEGENCTYYDSCKSSPCQNQGECSKTGNDSDKTHKCLCQLGYEGQNCNKINVTTGQTTEGRGELTTANKTNKLTQTASNSIAVTKDGTPIIVGASAGGGVVVIIACVVGFYLNKRKREKITSEDATKDTGRNDEFNIEKISKSESVAFENTVHNLFSDGH